MSTRIFLWFHSLPTPLIKVLLTIFFQNQNSGLYSDLIGQKESGWHVFLASKRVNKYASDQKCKWWCVVWKGRNLTLGQDFLMMNLSPTEVEIEKTKMATQAEIEKVRIEQ